DAGVACPADGTTASFPAGSRSMGSRALEGVTAGVSSSQLSISVTINSERFLPFSHERLKRSLMKISLLIPCRDLQTVFRSMQAPIGMPRTHRSLDHPDAACTPGPRYHPASTLPVRL